MITDASVQLATLADAAAIAVLSRDQIEAGLGWSWTPARIERAIRNPDTNVAVIREHGAILAFGIMSYRDATAYLLLFAVDRAHRRRGIGSIVLRWLETVARAAGVDRIHVECRRVNDAARNFYGEHGYHELDIRKGYYQGVEDAVRLEKRLLPESPEA